MRPGGIPSVDAAEAARLLGDGEDAAPVLLDVRERDEWLDARAPDAVLVPMSVIQARVGELPDRPLLVICHSGNRSLAVTNWLRGLGRDATNVAGGMIAWSRAGLPVRSGAPEAGEGELPTG
ncbi:MAG TPA: rhodanese-like domain-containing protein [Candidatus Limnocylindrales bacterium]|nr:rhodanese-like domain-containing protein [Candidatus Limnocylindrales bacterium]